MLLPLADTGPRGQININGYINLGDDWSENLNEVCKYNLTL